MVEDFLNLDGSGVYTNTEHIGHVAREMCGVSSLLEDSINKEAIVGVVDNVLSERLLAYCVVFEKTSEVLTWHILVEFRV